MGMCMSYGTFIGQMSCLWSCEPITCESPCVDLWSFGGGVCCSYSMNPLSYLPVCLLMRKKERRDIG